MTRWHFRTAKRTWYRGVGTEGQVVLRVMLQECTQMEMSVEKFLSPEMAKPCLSQGYNLYFSTHVANSTSSSTTNKIAGEIASEISTKTFYYALCEQVIIHQTNSREGELANIYEGYTTSSEYHADCTGLSIVEEESIEICKMP